MKKTTLAVVVSSSLVTSSTVFANAITESTDDGYVTAGDYLQIAVPVTGLVAAWLHDDGEGAKQLAYSFGVTTAIVHTTKFAVGRTRPNASNTASFPSGHTAAAFSGAAFLQSRYGAAWGIPGYIAATYVGASRIYGNRHYADDVVAGAGIAFLTNQFFVSPYMPEGVSVNVLPTSDGVMVGLSVTNQAFEYNQDHTPSNSAYQKEKRHRFQLDVGFNQTDTLSELGADKTIASSEPLDPDQPFATALYNYKIDPESSLEVIFSPNETRRTGEVTEDFLIGDKTYFTGEDIFVSLRQWSIGGVYYRDYQLDPALSFSAGVGLNAYLVEFEGDLAEGGKHGSESDYPILPTVALKGRYNFTADWSLRGRVDYQTISKDEVINAEAGMYYQFNPDWDAGLKYAFSRSEWDKSQVKYHTDSIVISIANRF